MPLTFGFGYDRKWQVTFDTVSFTAESDCWLMVPLLVTAITRKTAFGRSLVSTYGPMDAG